MWPCCLNQHQILLVLSDCGRNNKLGYSTEHLKNRHTLFIGCLFGCVFVFLDICAAEEAGVCVSGEACGGAAGPGLALHQHLPAGSQGTVEHVNTVSHSTQSVSFCFHNSKLFGCSNQTVFSSQDPNQFIRASALRVLSSIRVPIIVPIMMLAIKEASADLSPYVRKTAAHAIQKLYRYTSARLLSILSLTD